MQLPVGHRSTGCQRDMTLVVPSAPGPGSTVRPRVRHLGDRMDIRALVRRLVPAMGSGGQGLAEYALILALIAIVAIVALIFLGEQISAILNEIAGSI